MTRTLSKPWGYLLTAAALLAAPCTFETCHAAGWKLVFSDEFTGNTLDRSRWATRYIYNNERQDKLNDEKQRYRDNANHIVSGGVLQLVARPAAAGLFESGMIRSVQTFYYGYFETRVLLPKGRGIWPAFWLNSDYDEHGKLSWPPEIDVFEYAVNGKDDTAAMVHSAASNIPRDKPIQYLYSDPGYKLRLRSYVADKPLNEGWHVFGLVWTPQTVTVLLDGKRLYTRQYDWIRKDGTLGGPAHVILNFAVGGKWAGRYGIDTQLFPQALQIDYVRVCQFTSGRDGGATCGGSSFTPDPSRYGYTAPFEDLPKVELGSASVRGMVSAKEINIPLTVPSGLHGQRTLNVALTRQGQIGKMVATTVDIGTKTTHPLLAKVVVPTAMLSKGTYQITAQLLYDDHSTSPEPVPTPIRCNSSIDQKIKARSCLVGKVDIN